MRWYDISLPLHPAMATWPGDPPVALEPVATLNADGAAVSRLTLGTHSGTHLDAPRHLLPGGQGVEAWPLAQLIGPARVLHLPDVGPNAGVTAEHLREAGISSATTRLLLRTANSDRGLLRQPTFSPHYVSLTLDAAEYLVACGVRLVGIDALSVDPYEAEAGPVHRLLLEHHVAILEGLDLSDVPPGEYTLVCLPLPLIDADGAPTRAVLLDADDHSPANATNRGAS